MNVTILGNESDPEAGFVEECFVAGGAHISRSPAQGVDRVKRILAWYERVRS